MTIFFGQIRLKWRYLAATTYITTLKRDDEGLFDISGRPVHLTKAD